MTQPLNFRRSEAAVQTILPPLTDEDRIRSFLRQQGHSVLQINQFLRGHDLVSQARRVLGIKD